MLNNINGLLLKVTEETQNKNFIDKEFEIVYFEKPLKHKIYLILKNVYVVNLNKKRMWIYLIKNNDFKEKRLFYGEIVKHIHSQITPFLISRYSYEPDIVLIDHISSLSSETKIQKTS